MVTAGVTLRLCICEGLAVNRVTPKMLFVGDYYSGPSEVGIYHSTDGGYLWTGSRQDTDIGTLLVHLLMPTLVFTSDRYDGLYR